MQLAKSPFRWGILLQRPEKIYSYKCEAFTARAQFELHGSWSSNLVRGCPFFVTFFGQAKKVKKTVLISDI